VFCQGEGRTGGGEEEEAILHTHTHRLLYCTDTLSLSLGIVNLSVMLSPRTLKVIHRFRKVIETVHSLPEIKFSYLPKEFYLSLMGYKVASLDIHAIPQRSCVK
jgi:hypothetical protein